MRPSVVAAPDRRSPGPCDATRAARRRPPTADRDPLLAAWRAQLEGPAFQRPAPDTVLGGRRLRRRHGACRRAGGGARRGRRATSSPLARRRPGGRSGKVQGRNSTVALATRSTVPDGDWALTLRTTWVEPAYLEPDASWCHPGGVPGVAAGQRRRLRGQAPLAGGGRRARSWPTGTGRAGAGAVVAGGRRPPRAQAAAGGPRHPGRRDRRAPGRPHAGSSPDGSALDSLDAGRRPVGPGRVRGRDRRRGRAAGLGRPPWRPAGSRRRSLWPRCARARGGPRRSGDAGRGRRAGRRPGPGGRRRRARCRSTSGPGSSLDPVTLRSYCIGAVHQALGWVWQEGIAVDAAGEVHDLTIRSFGDPHGARHSRGWT